MGSSTAERMSVSESVMLNLEVDDPMSKQLCEITSLLRSPRKNESSECQWQVRDAETGRRCTCI